MSKSYDWILLIHFCCLSCSCFYSKKNLRLLWLVLTLNLFPTRYYRNLANACMMANISLSYMGYNLSSGRSFQLSKATGWPPCINTAPIPSPDASLQNEWLREIWQCKH